jgi:hypothetical protein
MFKKERFKQLEKTCEYMETNYFDNQPGQKTRAVSLTLFWCDYADHLLTGNSKFLTSNFTDCYENAFDKFCCLVLLDLPH